MNPLGTKAQTESYAVRCAQSKPLIFLSAIFAVLSAVTCADLFTIAKMIRWIAKDRIVFRGLK